MPFRGFLSKAHSNATKFFGGMSGHAKAGLKFFNTTLVPLARGAHSAAKAITEEIQSQPNIAPGVRQKVQNFSRFSDLGLGRLDQVQASTNRVAQKLNLA